MDAPHIPVLVREAVEVLGPALHSRAVLIDCTVGAGGHCAAFAAAFPELRVLGIDQDAQALDIARGRLATFGSRIRLVQANFDALEQVVVSAGLSDPAAVFYDLGVSSMQLDRPERGFRLHPGSPLDMRMDTSSALTAEEIVNKYSESALTDIISRYGEERFARRVARAIVARRRLTPFHQSGDLAEVVKAAIPAATRRSGPHPARRTFQALRIEVNSELARLSVSLHAAVGLLRPGGRAAVISYHSLEDRIVKGVFAEYARGCVCPKDLPVCSCGREADLRVITRKPLRPSPDETGANPRGDSAKMRAAEKLGKAA